MPNDAISREAAIEAVTLHLTTAPWKPDHPVVEALKSLPADTRWEELRAWIVARRDDIRSLYPYTISEATFDGVLEKMDRLAPAPAEAQD